MLINKYALERGSCEHRFAKKSQAQFASAVCVMFDESALNLHVSRSGAALRVGVKRALSDWC